MSSFNQDKLSTNDILPRVKDESLEIHQLKLLNKTDINMMSARRTFERPAYYTRFLKSHKEGDQGEG